MVSRRRGVASAPASGKAGRATVRGASDAVVQLSRSRRARRLGWLYALLGKEPHQHWLHLELRLPGSGARVGVSARVREELVDGLPQLEQSAPALSEEQMVTLLTQLRRLGARVAMSERHDEAALSAVVLPRAWLYEGLKSLTHLMVVGLYLFPLLLLPKILLFAFGVGLGDWITVAYVVLVLAFFALLALLVLLFPWVGPATETVGGTKS